MPGVQPHRRRECAFATVTEDDDADNDDTRYYAKSRGDLSQEQDHSDLITKKEGWILLLQEQDEGAVGIIIF